MDRIASPQQLQRLHEIARDLGAELTEDTLPLSPPRQRPTFKVPDDDRKADAVLGQSRIELSQVQSRPKGLRRAFSTTKLSGSHSYEEIYIALTRVIEENDLIGVAEVLLDRFRQLGGDINVARRASTGLIKKIRNADSPEERGHLLESATDKGRVDAVQLFAPDADQPSLNESLRIALQRKNLAITEVLLQYGANASVHQQIFQKAASNGEVELLKLMLRAPQRIPEHCVTRSLLHATANGSLLAVQLLVTAGAKGDHDGAAAFINAVEMDRIDLVAAILVGPSPPSPVSIDLGLKTALAARSNNFMERYNIIELLLCAGPFGHAKDEGLVKATLFANLELIQLFLWYQADINYHGGSAIASAIQRNRADIFGILLQEQGLKTEVASELVASISRIGPSAERLSLLEKVRNPPHI
ncbi:hypothetical protein PVAG01_04396 [Phlyctema vagabunda]|uniref:Ankyrin repeat protein n=1 Tax=Phlyctema vagabunda TaxID=108571 RepID=A0ABR4PP68_9HELO